MCLRNKGLYLLGDLKDKLLSNGNRLNVILSTNKPHETVNKPTRVTPQSATLLDIVATNIYLTVIHKNVIPNVIVDHDLSTVILNIAKHKHKTVMKMYRHLGVYSNDAMCYALLTETLTLNKIPLTDNVDIQMNILTSAFTNCQENVTS